MVAEKTINPFGLGSFQIILTSPFSNSFFKSPGDLITCDIVSVFIFPPDTTYTIHTV